ncbi:hypothetical protein AZI86_14150 [Bdellovibrio bacteriovorus]|uniref:Uncharacterized protein n=2 Tax=Bdellovibrio bacteriovorus TaxID=959 RepID=A0A150WJK5_BDEBC|nr:hypothetical protein AZI86_14150 [Bdellovibrio bacteriovorus]
MGVGFLHGVLPEGLSRTYIQTPTQIQVLTTDEILFPADVRMKIESELHVRFSVVVTRDWDSILAHVVSSPGVDLLFLPSFWARTLGSQHLLADVSSLKSRVASDFIGDSAKGDFQFLPFYWMKTSIVGPLNEPFDQFLQNKKENVLFLLADEDLILRHFQIWKEQGIFESISQKKILTLQLDQILTEDARLGAVEGPLLQEPAKSGPHRALLNALLIWGAAIPASSSQKALALDVLDLLTSVEYQQRDLLKTPFNSALSAVNANQIPLQRRAEAVRNLQLKDTIILERKNKDAKTQLRNDFNFIL